MGCGSEMQFLYQCRWFVHCQGNLIKISEHYISFLDMFYLNLSSQKSTENNYSGIFALHFGHSKCWQRDFEIRDSRVFLMNSGIHLNFLSFSERSTHMHYLTPPLLDVICLCQVRSLKPASYNLHFKVIKKD